jgi:DNA-binding LacI/PurR family transcriptional regulator
MDLASIKDVAKAAGVSTSTVSRIINNSPLISAETREKTLKVMKELNYVPNSMARGLSNQKAFTVALLVNISEPKAYSNPFFYEVIHGIETIVYNNGLCLIIANMQTPTKKENMLDWLIHGKRTQGVILPSAIVDSQMVRDLKKMKFPFVVLGEPADCREPIDWVDVNNRQGGQQAVDHLLQKGYKNIAFIGGSRKEIFNRNRLAGYREALEASGIEYNPEYVREGGGSKEDGAEMVRDLLKLSVRPDAVICGDNFLSLGAMKAIFQAGLRVPADMGVLSFDNFPIADLAEPSLTTVDIDVFEMGVQAANQLFKRIENPSVREKQSLIATRIEERESTGRAR